MPDGGRLAIHATQQGDRLVLSVADTGRGIPPERIPTVFDPLSSQPGEVGLGLSIAWNLVAANGGTIEVESKVGRGTTFTVWLPVHPPEQPV
jgi:two-component system NtrC family sensor kinase